MAMDVSVGIDIGGTKCALSVGEPLSDSEAAMGAHGRKM